MSDTENITSFNSSSTECERCSFTSVLTPVILLLITVNWMLTLPCGSWAVWLLARGSRATLEAEFFLLHLFCTDIACVFLNVFSFFNYYFLCKKNTVGVFLYQLCLHGLPLFQSLVCVERYVAVVHPVTFLRYKRLRYKAAALFLTWTVAMMVEIIHYFLYNPLTVILILIPVVCTELFCSLSILRVLKRPSPGTASGTRERRKGGNLLKKKAFIIISLLLLKLLMNYMPIIVVGAFNPAMSVLKYRCSMYSTVVLICFFGSFVQPWLYLHRAGKLPFIFPKLHFLRN